MHGVLKDERELEFMKELGVELMPYRNVLNDLRGSITNHNSSIASNIADIIKYLHGS